MSFRGSNRRLIFLDREVSKLDNFAIRNQNWSKIWVLIYDVLSSTNFSLSRSFIVKTC